MRSLLIQYVVLFPIVLPLSMTGANAQKQMLYTELSLRYAGDAEMAHIGPSLSMGVRKNLDTCFSVGLTYTYFEHPMFSETQDYFVTHTFDLMTEYHFNILNARGFFCGVGLAHQTLTNSFYGVYDRTNFIGAYSLGYDFKMRLFKRKHLMTVDTKGFGPYREGSYIEILTQHMVGLRFRF